MRDVHGSADDGISGDPNCKVIDVVRNSQGEGFMDFKKYCDVCCEWGEGEGCLHVCVG